MSALFSPRTGCDTKERDVVRENIKEERERRALLS